MNLFESSIAPVVTTDNAIYLEAVKKIFNILFEDAMAENTAPEHKNLGILSMSDPVKEVQTLVNNEGARAVLTQLCGDIASAIHAIKESPTLVAISNAMGDDTGRAFYNAVVNQAGNALLNKLLTKSASGITNKELMQSLRAALVGDPYGKSRDGGLLGDAKLRPVLLNYLRLIKILNTVMVHPEVEALAKNNKPVFDPNSENKKPVPVNSVFRINDLTQLKAVNDAAISNAINTYGASTVLASVAAATIVAGKELGRTMYKDLVDTECLAKMIPTSTSTNAQLYENVRQAMYGWEDAATDADGNPVSNNGGLVEIAKVPSAVANYIKTLTTAVNLVCINPKTNKSPIKWTFKDKDENEGRDVALGEWALTDDFGAKKPGKGRNAAGAGVGGNGADANGTAETQDGNTEAAPADTSNAWIDGTKVGGSESTITIKHVPSNIASSLVDYLQGNVHMMAKVRRGIGIEPYAFNFDINNTNDNSVVDVEMTYRSSNTDTAKLARNKILLYCLYLDAKAAKNLGKIVTAEITAPVFDSIVHDMKIGSHKSLVSLFPSNASKSLGQRGRAQIDDQQINDLMTGAAPDLINAVSSFVKRNDIMQVNENDFIDNVVALATNKGVSAETATLATDNDDPFDIAGEYDAGQYKDWLGQHGVYAKLVQLTNQPYDAAASDNAVVDGNSYNQDASRVITICRDEATHGASEEYSAAASTEDDDAFDVMDDSYTSVPSNAEASMEEFAEDDE